VTYSVESGLATVRLARDHGNAINGNLLDGLAEAYHAAREDPEVRGVLLAAAGKLFCPGLDLIELAGLERRPMERFMVRFRDVLLDLYTMPKPVVAALSGHALAGGCVLALTADRRILRRGSMVGLNEVRVGVPLPFGVAHILRDTVHRPRLEEVALLGRNYQDEEAVAAGLAHEVHEAEGFEEHCRARLEEMASRDLRALAVTKRYLRTATAGRIHGEDHRHLKEFLDCWFSRPTRARIEAIVADLKARSA
jgi:enoyl-CoA hydratase